MTASFIDLISFVIEFDIVNLKFFNKSCTNYNFSSNHGITVITTWLTSYFVALFRN